MIHAAGSPGPGLNARPNALVVLVNTKLRTPAATDSSSSTSVPVMLVCTNDWRSCDPTCGLCSVAACKTACTPGKLFRTRSRSVIEPTTVVNGESSRSRPTTSCPCSRSTRTSASPRCPELPVTSTFPPPIPTSYQSDQVSSRRRRLSILAKLPGQDEASRVTAALRRDDSMRIRYMTAVIARVCGVDWQTAAHLAGSPTEFPQPGLAASAFTREVVNDRDAGARWCSAAMLQALSPMIGR